MTRRTRIIVLSVGLIAVFVIVYSLRDRGPGSGPRSSLAEESIIVVHGVKDILSSEKQIVKIQEARNISRKEAEDIYADLLIQMRKAAMQESDGRGPGAFIVADVNEAEAREIRSNLAIIRRVPIGSVTDIPGAGKAGGVKLEDPSTLSTAATADHDLAFFPIDVQTTELRWSIFSGYTFAGTFISLPEHITSDRLKEVVEADGIRRGWTGITRVFDNVEGIGRVVLDESSLPAGRTTLEIPRSAINAQIGSNPGTLYRIRDDNGSAMSSLSWVEPDGRMIAIKIANVDDSSVGKMKELAQDISRSLGVKR